MQTCVTAFAALQKRHTFDNQLKEAVPIEPNQQPRRISTSGITQNGGTAPQPGAGGPRKAGKNPQTPKKKKKKRFGVIGFILRFIGCLLCVCVMAGCVGAVLLSMYVVQVTADDGEILDLDNQKNKQTTIIYDKNGEEYARLTKDENRIWRELSAMPEDVQHAVIAIEDKNFYNEPGINAKRTVAAALNEFTGNRLLGSQQGASTLEQQLIKNLTKDNETDIMRKVREIFRALGLAKKYSKETVLEAYLNTIPLTGIVCGMEAGAQEYFGKPIEDVTLAEAAALASITKNPTRYNPFTNPQILIARRNHVLYEMWQQGYITENEYRSAAAESIVLVENSATENATRTSQNSYFTDAVYDQLMTDLTTRENYTSEEASNMIFSGGLRVYSTVDPFVQDKVEKMMLNEEDQFPALWHQEAVCLRDYPAGDEDKVQYDEKGMPLRADGSSLFTDDDIPIYVDDEKTTLKMGTSTDDNYPNDDQLYVCFYENVRTQAAISILDYDGNIVALAGGLGEKKYDRGTNRATIPHQTGSTMKPIGAYCLALDYKLITYSTPIPDTPYYSAEQKMVLDTDAVKRLNLPNDRFSPLNLARDDVWRSWPTNYGGAGGKGANMLIYDALRQSYNTVAVWVGSMVQADYIFNFVHDTLHAQYLDPVSDVDLGPIVLGSQSRGMTTVELAGAYSIFNDGSFTTPHYYTEVTDYLGNTVLDNGKFITTTQAISPATARIMNRMLYNVLHDSAGTAYGRAPAGEMEAVAKTGTTSDYKDYTFAGLTPYYVSALWWGCDKPTNMYDLGTAGRNGKPMQYAWKALMEEIQADLPVKEFADCEDVVTRRFDTSSGSLTSAGGGVGYYTEDNLPDGNYATTSDAEFAAAAQAAAEQAQAQQAAAGEVIVTG